MKKIIKLNDNDIFIYNLEIKYDFYANGFVLKNMFDINCVALNIEILNSSIDTIDNKIYLKIKCKEILYDKLIKILFSYKNLATACAIFIKNKKLYKKNIFKKIIRIFKGKN